MAIDNDRETDRGSFTWRSPLAWTQEEDAVRAGIAFERQAFAEDFGICRVSGCVDEPLMLYAPRSEDPRLHLQLVETGNCALVNETGDTAMSRGESWQHVSLAGDTAWRTPSEQRFAAFSIDVSVGRIARWLGRGEREILGRLRHDGSRLVAPAPEMLLLSARLDSPGEDSLRRIELEILTLQLIARWAGNDWHGDHSSTRAVVHAARERLQGAEVPTSVSALADALDVAPLVLQRRYREEFGESLFRSLLAARMRAAAQALAEGDMPVKQIAWQAGYKQVSSFSAAFRQHFGVAPSALRPPSRSG